jgi:type I protein arginine methyltransferase
MLFTGKIIRSTVRHLKDWAKSSETVRSILYDLRNSEGFGDLYEHEKMLADRARVDAYVEAIKRLVQPEHVVLDLGTGTGLLAMLAARRGAKRVYAIDHSKFIEIAKLVARCNGIDNITFVQQNSRSFSPPEKIDIIVHEQLGDALFNENMLENLFDLKRRVLKTTGRILPGRFELFLEPVSLKPAHSVPYLWENSIDGLEFKPLRDNAALRPYQLSNHGTRFIPVGAVSHFLGRPAPVLTLDVNEVDDIKAVPTTFQQRRSVVQGGTMDGFCLYFRADFDETTSFGISPVEVPATFRSWGNTLFRAPQHRYVSGDEITYRVVLSELTDPSTWSVVLT